VLEGKQRGCVFAGCDFRSVICELHYRTSRVQTCVRELVEAFAVIRESVIRVLDFKKSC
jgi:hypothetical protein